MDKISFYKKRMIKHFFLSIDKDINDWRLDWGEYLVSPVYDQYNFEISLKSKKIIVKSKNKDIDDFILANYSFIFNNKIWRYVQKLHKHFKKEDEHIKEMQENIKYKKIINNFETIVSKLDDNFNSDIRKEKLKKLK